MSLVCLVYLILHIVVDQIDIEYKQQSRCEEVFALYSGHVRAHVKEMEDCLKIVHTLEIIVLVPKCMSVT